MGEVARGTAPYGRFALACKRTFDVVVASAVLVLLAPLFVLLAVLIKLDSHGPVFFRQERVGRHRRIFLMWKFRKMRHDTPSTGGNLTRRYDSRMTRVGRLLERTKFDELPQFFNVLCGDMSIIGPRPELVPFVAYYADRWDAILAVKPGIFGPCQVRFRNESELYPPGCRDIEKYHIEHILPAKMAIDTVYASRFSLTGDMVLFVQTVLVSLGGIVTRQTLINRRWQILNTIVLSVAGFAGTWAVLHLLGHGMTPRVVWWVLLFSAVAKPICVIAFRIPLALATSVTADDLLRCCWCAAVSGALLGCAEIVAGFRDLGRSVLLVDTVLFFATLILYKLTCYNIYRCFFRPSAWGLWQQLVLASLVVGPLSMMVVLLARYGSAVWQAPQAVSWPILLPLALAIRPAVFLFKPIAGQDGPRPRPLRESWQIVVAALVGSSLIVSGAMLLNERAIGRLDMACDSALYALVMTGVAWRSWRRAGGSAAVAEGEAAPKERLLLVGEGADLGGYVTALASLPEHRFEVVGALSTSDGYRTNMAGTISVLGEITDAPEIVRGMDVTRVVVLDTDISDADLDELRSACALKEEQVLRVEILSPLMRL